MTDFDEIVNDMRERGMALPPQRIFFSVPNAKIVFENALNYFLKMQGVEKKSWIDGYDEIAEWLLNNEGRGLFIYGNCGLGKSVIARYCIPAILKKYCGKIMRSYDTSEMNAKLDELLALKLICIDDIGTEEINVNFGLKRLSFSEIMDKAEKNGNLVVVTSNLNIEQLKAKYGDRTVDRIISTTKRVLLTGKSLRK